MYGGTDRAVEQLKKTRDPNIYHGTLEQNLPAITKEGLKPGGRLSWFGKGVYFGPKKVADYYGRDNQETRKGAVKGALVRLKRPSELRGTRAFYPDPTRAQVFGISKDVGLHELDSAARKASPMFGGSPIDRLVRGSVDLDPVSPNVLRKKIMKRLSELPKEELQKMELKMFKNKGLSPEEIKIKLLDSEKFGPSVYELAKDQAAKTLTPKDPKKFNKLKYYGIRGRKTIFERLKDTENMNQFHVDGVVPPELLTVERGKLPQSLFKKIKGMSSKAKLGLGAGATALGIGTAIALHRRRKKLKDEIQQN